MSDELPAELHPDDLPDDPEVLKQLVCDLYTTVLASDELLTALDDGPASDGTDLGWLTEHLEPTSPVDGDASD